MANSTRILTHKTQRKLTTEQVRALLSAYVETDATYRTLSAEYGICQRAVSDIVRGFNYRDLTELATLREKAQEKAAARSSRYCNAESARILDTTKKVIEVNFNSVASVDAALLRLLAVRSLLIGPAAEVSL